MPTTLLARDRSEGEGTNRSETAAFVSPVPGSLGSFCSAEREGIQVAYMSFRIGGDDRDEELFGTAAAVSGGESDADDEDHFPDGGAGDHQGQSHRLFVPQPLRRMNSDSIYDMSSMTAQLPAKKKGLSRYYEGRSQSFACMSEVQCLEDLQKKDNPYKQKIKACKSYAALRGIAKAAKSSSNSCADLSIAATNGFRAQPIHVNKNGYLQ